MNSTATRTPTVTFQRNGSVAEIVLSSPPLNLLGDPFLRDLRTVLDHARASDARAILVHAQGPNFSAGADVHMFEGQTEDSARELLTTIVELFDAIQTLPVPTLAAAHGYCLAGGLELALACDLLWTADTAQLGLVEATIGAIPFAGGTQRLAAKIGTARALEMIYKGTIYPAAKLRDWGLINHIVSADELLDQARTFASELAAGPTVAHAATKAILHADPARSSEMTIVNGARAMASRDLQDAVRSLLATGPGNARFHNR